MQLDLKTLELRLYSNGPEVIIDSPEAGIRIGELRNGIRIRGVDETPISTRPYSSSTSASIPKSHADEKESHEEPSSKKSRFEPRYKTSSTYDSVELKLDIEVKLDDNNKYMLVAKVTNETQTAGIDLPDQLGAYQFGVVVYKKEGNEEDECRRLFCGKGTKLIDNILLFTDGKLVHLSLGEYIVYNIDIGDYYQLANGIYRIKCQLDIISDEPCRQYLKSNLATDYFVVQLDGFQTNKQGKEQTNKTKNDAIVLLLDTSLLNCTKFCN